ncbi:glycosyltransferase family 2 protein [Calothrix sp. 336/3]|uniref:glycosyltransferase family 2 protein n=1 Tax=Calothrix sp. 336/3 TaxID=1337936 RepID=UPI0004E2CF5C|nr:glycosyltransferase family 2 protein [Calothrix sp. 336/3]AKG21132.1 glycosyltransferase [Calothrix sp. 336/3]
MEIKRLAVLMTCHNRRAKTLACLEALFRQETTFNIQTQVYLVDDGSSDGTGDAIRHHYPQVKVLLGNGNLFWNRGMRLAFAEAMKSNYDYYLWLNDDTLLYKNALETLFQASKKLIHQGHRHSVVVGSTQDIKTGVFTYGGMEKQSWWHPLKFRPIEPEEGIKPCLTMNGNCVLIPQEVAKAVGNLDASFSHSTGDVDYGLRVQKQGGNIWIASGYIGTCEYNPLRQQAWDDLSLSLKERWEKINQPRGLPIKEWKVFCHRHAGAFWMIYWLLPYARLTLKTVKI